MTDAEAALPPAVRWQEATVTARTSQTVGITSFLVAPDRPFAFRAGQHVDVRLTAEDGYRAIRSYSIASAPGGPGPIELAVELLADGEVSPFFHDVVAVGDRIEIKAPLGGHFVWTEADGGPLLLIGGGSGVVPLMSMIRHRAEVGSRAPALLLLSARTWADVLFRNELLALAARNDGFALVLALTREAPRREGDFACRIDTPMMGEALGRLPAAPRLVFVCGTNGFVNAAADGAIATGVPAASIRTERYGGL